MCSIGLVSLLTLIAPAGDWHLFVGQLRVQLIAQYFLVIIIIIITLFIKFYKRERPSSCSISHSIVHERRDAATVARVKPGFQAALDE